MEKLKILIVEDDYDVMHLLDSLLSFLGFSNFEKAYNGQQAWEKVQKQKFDLIISDFDMPVMNGLALLKKLRKDKFTEKVVIMSGGNHEDDFKEVKPDMYLSKPIDLEKIKQIFSKFFPSVKLPF